MSRHTMNPTRRSLPAVLAAVAAMVASALALAALVVSDIAEARANERERVVLADEPTTAPPVVMKKVLVKAEEPSLEVLGLGKVKFGRFEGY